MGVLCHSCLVCKGGSLGDLLRAGSSACEWLTHSWGFWEGIIQAVAAPRPVLAPLDLPWLLREQPPSSS